MEMEKQKLEELIRKLIPRARELNLTEKDLKKIIEHIQHMKKEGNFVIYEQGLGGIDLAYFLEMLKGPEENLRPNEKLRALFETIYEAIE